MKHYFWIDFGFIQSALAQIVPLDAFTSPPRLLFEKKNVLWHTKTFPLLAAVTVTAGDID